MLFVNNAGVIDPAHVCVILPRGNSILLIIVCLKDIPKSLTSTRLNKLMYIQSNFFSNFIHPDFLSHNFNQGSGSGRARRDAAARAMQGWHSQRLLGNGEVSDPIIKVW